MAQRRIDGQGDDVHAAGARVTQPWETLFSKAMTLLDYASSQSGNSLFWTMGGGTVLMLRHHHRNRCGDRRQEDVAPGS